MSSAHRDELISKLRIITGWRDLSFDDEGFLRVSKLETDSGSTTARALLSKALWGEDVVVLEDASDRADVAFCRVVPARRIGARSEDVRVFVVLIDFRDFECVTGDNRARAAFDVGWGLLHELDHVVYDSKDAVGVNEAGDCEQRINEMRREVGVPLRASYFYTPLRFAGDPNFLTRLVRLAFVESNESSMKVKRYWLVWDSVVVGGANENVDTALVKPRSSSR